MVRHWQFVVVAAVCLAAGFVIGSKAPELHAAGVGDGPYVLEVIQDSKGKVVAFRMNTKTGETVTTDTGNRTWWEFRGRKR